MTERRLRFSERPRLAETGSLGPIVDDDVPDELRRAVRAYISRRYFDLVGWEQDAAEHFGWFGGTSGADHLHNATVEEFADLIELYREHAERYAGWALRVETELNALFDRHRWAYRLEGRQVVRIGSPALSEVVVGPALLALQRPGWEEAERSFREALHHQRGGPDENDDALTAANAALEAALKAVGLHGNTLGDLATALRRSDLVPGQVAGMPDALDKLLKISGAVRNTMGDAHGKTANAEPVPQAVVDLAIHLAGAFIVFLSRSGD